jgi:hypothetical protein
MNYNKYNTGNPLEDSFLNEGKGIPNTLKWIIDDIIHNINLNESYSDDIEESDFMLKNLTINYINRQRKDIYAYSQFGIYSPVYDRGIFNNYLINSKIDIYLDFNDYDILDLKRVILHELLHIYEIFQRCNNKTDKDLDWFVNNEIMKIRKKYINDGFLSEFIYILYLINKHEINARVAETYTILIDDRNDNRQYLLDKLMVTQSWIKMKEIEDFKYTKYDIDFNRCKEFFIELNNIVNKRSNKHFKIYNIPNDDKDIITILKNYQTQFKKKTKYFKEKLYKIVDEVILDINRLNNS